MISTEKFTIRLEEIFDRYELNAAGFAEKIGIGRSSVSHIVSGRNKPSLDFIMHVLEHFPEITFDWLVYGKGSLGEKKQNNENPISEKKTLSSTSTKISSPEPSLFDFEKKSVPTRKKTNVTTESLNSNENEIELITVFYKDGTFKSYTPK